MVVWGLCVDFGFVLFDVYWFDWLCCVGCVVLNVSSMICVVYCLLFE